MFSEVSIVPGSLSRNHSKSSTGNDSYRVRSSSTSLKWSENYHRTRRPYKNDKIRSLDFSGRVVIVTGAGRGIGRSIAIMYARRGAKVVVNDVGCSLDGIGANRSKADEVVSKITGFGGFAIANYDSISSKNSLIATALKAYGKIDILVCNAGILTDGAFNCTTPQDWSRVMTTHLHSTNTLISECWPTFLRQGYGKIIVSATDEALSRPTLHIPYCTSKTALVGLIKCIAKEGEPFNIKINAFSPVALTRMNQSEFADKPSIIRYNLHSKKVAPLVGYLTHANCKETGSLFKVGLGKNFKLAYKSVERYMMDPAKSPDTILENLTSDTCFDDLVLAGVVVVVSGANTGFGQLISRILVEAGASVVIRQEVDSEYNRLRNQRLLMRISKRISRRLSSFQLLDDQTRPISLGEVSFVGDASFSETIKRAINQFGRLDAIIHCVSLPDGIDDREIQCKQNLDTPYLLAREAWPFFRSQKYGRILNISPLGDSSTYLDAVKYGLIGMSSSLTAEGRPFDICANTLICDYDQSKLDSRFAASVACLLTHKCTPFRGRALELNRNQLAVLGLIPSRGLNLNNKLPTWDHPEAIQKNFNELIKFDEVPVETRSLENLINANLGLSLI